MTQLAKVGRFIQSERRKRKIPITQFARNLGVSVGALRRMENSGSDWPEDKSGLAIRLLTRRDNWPDAMTLPLDSPISAQSVR